MYCYVLSFLRCNKFKPLLTLIILLLSVIQLFISARCFLNLITRDATISGAVANHYYTSINSHTSIPVGGLQWAATVQKYQTAKARENDNDDNEEDEVITMIKKKSSGENNNTATALSSSSWLSPLLSPKLPPSSNRRVYDVFWCGHSDFADNMAKCLFDDARKIIMLSEQYLGNNHSKHDVLVASLGGPCIVHTRLRSTGTKAPALFHGSILYVSGEPKPMYPLDIRDRLFGLSANTPNDTKRNIRSFFGAMYASCSLSNNKQQLLFDANAKAQNSGERFLIYAQSNCANHREVAFAKISHLGRSPAYYGGRCRGNRIKAKTTLVDEELVSKKWLENHKLLRKYRFALVLEKTKEDGYITEKIVNAFLAGCVPIYYGTEEIFEIFNPQAFIYYDIEAPQTALDHIAYLEQNETAYMDMLKNQPILKNGEATIKEFFSFSNDLGGGHLKKQIRNMMRMDTV